MYRYADLLTAGYSCRKAPFTTLLLTITVPPSRPVENKYKLLQKKSYLTVSNSNF